MIDKTDSTTGKSNYFSYSSDVIDSEISTSNPFKYVAVSSNTDNADKSDETDASTSKTVLYGRLAGEYRPVFGTPLVNKHKSKTRVEKIYILITENPSKNEKVEKKVENKSEKGILDILFPAHRVKIFKENFDSLRRMLSATFK